MYVEEQQVPSSPTSSSLGRLKAITACLSFAVSAAS